MLKKCTSISWLHEQCVLPIGKLKNSVTFLCVALANAGLLQKRMVLTDT